MEVDLWLERHGFRFNPFSPQYLRAEADEHLFDYFVAHPLLVPLGRIQSFWIAAEPGSGKTALRRYVVNQLWDRLLTNRRNRPLPLSLSFHTEEQYRSNTEPFWEQWMQQLSLITFIAILYRPDIFEKLSKTDQKQLGLLWDIYLYGGIQGLQEYIQKMKQGETLKFLGKLYNLDTLGALYTWEPETEHLRRVEELLKNLASLSNDYPISRFSSAQVAHEVWEWLQNTWSLRNLYLFIDGLDNFANFANALRPQSGFVRFLYEALERFAEISIKIFVPDEVEEEPLSTWLQSNRELPFSDSFVEIHWSPGLLREVVDRRIAIATSQELLGLDDLVDIEQVGLLSRRLARQARTPRQILQYTYNLLSLAAQQDLDLITYDVIKTAPQHSQLLEVLP